MRIVNTLLVFTLCSWATLAGAGERVLVAASFANQLAVFAVAAPLTSLPPVTVGLMPQDVVATSDGKSVYTANYISHDLSEIDPLSLSVRRTITLSCAPSDLALSPDSSTAYAVCRNTGRIVYVDLAAGTESGSTAVPFPHSVAIAADGRKAYVSRSMFSRNVEVIDLERRTVTASIVVGRSPQGMAVSPSGRSLFVANAGSASVSVIDTASEQTTATIAVGSGPCALAVDSTETMLYVANRNDATVSVVDLRQNRTIAAIPVGLSPQALALADSQPLLYVANLNSNTVSAIDTLTQALTATIPVPNGPQALALLGLDATPPEISLAVDTPVLWPPNHKLVPVEVRITVADDQDPAPMVQLVGISSSEPCSGEASAAVRAAEKAAAAPQTCGDIADAVIGGDDRSFSLRAERLGGHPEGRIYTITYMATDAAGNQTTAAVTVRVPHHPD